MEPDLRNSTSETSETSEAPKTIGEATNKATKSLKSTLNSVEELDAGNEMERSLSNRHIQFIAIGGTIGTGLFLGSGKSIALTGPSIIFVYIIIGLFMYILMRAIGEMMYRDPSQHTFINFITKYLGRGWGKFAGWSYWLVLILIGMTEISAVSTYFVTFFATFGINLSSWKWLIELAFLVVLSLVNLIAVKVFGEAEFWFSMIKITLIVGMMVTAVVMVIIHFHYPATRIAGADHVSPGATASFSNLFANFSLAPRGWYKFVIAFPMVFFAYELMEFVGVTVSETKDPRAILPKATNQLIYRILIFYVGALVAIMSIVPWKNFVSNSDGSFTSPFIMVFKYAGVDWAATLVFFVVVTAASSALNSLLYSAGRHLYQLANESKSDSLLRWMSLDQISMRHVPSRAIIFSACMIVLSPIINSFPQISSAFTLFSSASSAVIIVIYVLTLIAHMRYRRGADFTPEGFVLPAYKFFDIAAIVFFALIYITLFFAADTVVQAIGGIVWLVIFGAYSQRKYRQESPQIK